MRIDQVTLKVQGGRRAGEVGVGRSQGDTEDLRKSDVARVVGSYVAAQSRASRHQRPGWVDLEVGRVRVWLDVHRELNRR